MEQSNCGLNNYAYLTQKKKNTFYVDNFYVLKYQVSILKIGLREYVSGSKKSHGNKNLDTVIELYRFQLRILNLFHNIMYILHMQYRFEVQATE